MGSFLQIGEDGTADLSLVGADELPDENALIWPDKAKGDLQQGSTIS